MVIETREEQFEKALFPIEVTLLGIVADTREEQFEKAPFSTEVTPFGIVTDCFLAGQIISFFKSLLYKTPSTER